MKELEEVIAIMKSSPGLPVPNPTKSFWMHPPSVIASSKHSKALPVCADVAIIGSGMTGASVARTLLQGVNKGGDGTLKVVMLEARQTCSGATARNGGHLNPNRYDDYPELKEKYGIGEAKRIILFRQSQHVEMKRAAEEEGILEKSQCRAVESVDVYFSEDAFEQMKRNVAVWKEDMEAEAEDVRVYERDEAIQRFRVAADAVGAITCNGGAIHPYRFVTSILESLLAKFPKTFEIHTETPCTSVSPPSTSSPYYTIGTPRGTIQAKHIVYATNAWVSYLIPGLLGKIYPLLEAMSAQRPGTMLSSSTLGGRRLWTFFDEIDVYDYLTQMPDGEKELMYGGGARAPFSAAATDGDGSNLRRGTGLGGEGRNEGGRVAAGPYPALSARDDTVPRLMATHVVGSLPLRFGLENWGSESLPSDRVGEGQWFKGRTKAIWTGVIGMSADSAPWVGILSERMTGRTSTWRSAKVLDRSHPGLDADPSSEVQTSTRPEIQTTSLTAPSAEWISAGYSGDGMSHAWMCGRALAYMILGKEKEGGVEEWFPDVFRVSEKRWEGATPERILTQNLGG